jgi:glycosyltransferase involved in cell wall biosynthesis
MKEELSQLIAKLGIERGVRIHGFVENRILQKNLKAADLFLFPSLREFGGAVVMEAMTLGLVPLIVDYAGPREYVTELSGFKIPLAPRNELVEAFQKRLSYIKDNPDELAFKREIGKKRIVDHYSWDRKTEQILEVYDWVLGNSGKPNFYSPPLDQVENENNHVPSMDGIQTA